jgi:hypothetical protein
LRRLTHVARAQLSALASPDQIGHEPIAGCRSQQPNVVVLVVA